MNNTFNIYPYNYWILYAAIAILFVYLVITGLKAKNLIREVGTNKDEFKNIQSNLSASTDKVETIEKTFKKEKSNLSPYLRAALLFYAINQDYKRTKGHGIGDFNRSAAYVIANQEKKKSIFNGIKSFLK